MISGNGRETTDIAKQTRHLVRKPQEVYFVNSYLYCYIDIALKCLFSRYLFLYYTFLPFYALYLKIVKKNLAIVNSHPEWFLFDIVDLGAENEVVGCT